MTDVEMTSLVAAPRQAVWERVASVAGVNHELGPFLRMTAPSDVGDIDPATAPIGSRWFRSWVLLFHVIPVDYDDLTLIDVEPPHRFLERSPMLSMKSWQHERILEPDGDATRVTDRLTFTPRLGVLKPLAVRIVGFLFRHRHKRLVDWFAR